MKVSIAYNKSQTYFDSNDSRKISRSVRYSPEFPVQNYSPRGIALPHGATERKDFVASKSESSWGRENTERLRLDDFLDWIYSAAEVMLDHRGSVFGRFVRNDTLTKNLLLAHLRFVVRCKEDRFER